MKVRVDVTPENQNVVIKLAQKVWKKLYKGTRRSFRKKLAFKRGRVENTLSGFKRKRRSDAETLATTAPSRSLVDTRKSARQTGSQCWNAKMKKELDFNDLKRLKQFYQSIHEGTILPEEI
eukprot:8839295-Pyramimonas_sp.AAC.1